MKIGMFRVLMLLPSHFIRLSLDLVSIYYLLIYSILAENQLAVFCLEGCYTNLISLYLPANFIDIQNENGIC